MLALDRVGPVGVRLTRGAGLPPERAQPCTRMHTYARAPRASDAATNVGQGLDWPASGGPGTRLRLASKRRSHERGRGGAEGLGVHGERVECCVANNSDHKWLDHATLSSAEQKD